MSIEFVVHVLLGVFILVGMVFVNRQLAGIHELVNSNLTKAQASLAIAETRIRHLEDHIAHEPNARPDEEKRRLK